MGNVTKGREGILFCLQKNRDSLEKPPGPGQRKELEQ